MTKCVYKIDENGGAWDFQYADDDYVLPERTGNPDTDLHETPNFPKNDDEIYVIPVVVHVIHNGGSNNISDAQVHDAMRIINLDYKKLNSDTSQVISEFTNIVANVGLEFKLAKLTPDGECTKGITRTYSELTNSAGENVKDLVSN